MNTSRPVEGATGSVTAAQRQHWGRCRPSQVPLGMSCNRQRRQARGRIEVQSLNIDRRQHLEQAWRRQEAEQAAMDLEGSSCCGVDCVTELKNLAHLDRIVESASSSVVAIAFYSRSCGICKEMLKHYSKLCRESGGQMAGARFLKHNIRDDFDDLTDVARLYGIRAVPCFVFFIGGAQMKRMSMMDSRQNPEAVKRLIGWQRNRLDDSLREMIFRAAPSAHR
ncbi:g12289 [Coccomyxa viridis]|uniref:G12289 protein n=1 Tax=Coccomyxa viridis TaxID=1274662 RepID=A0ABP1G9Z6_9CHLO